MSLRSLIDGEKLINKTEHTGKTNSVGFCFLDWKDYEPEYAFHFLAGAVDTTDICVVFKTSEKLNKTYGVYAVPGGAFFDSFLADEYCIEEYDNTKFKMIKYCTDTFYKKNDKWKWHKEYNEENLKGLLSLAERNKQKKQMEREIKEILLKLSYEMEE